MSFSLDELRWLSSSSDANRAIAEATALPLTKKSVVADVATLRKEYGDYARALAELVEARRIAAAKMDPEHATSWWTDKDAAQQSTPMTVAEFRAQYLKNLGVERVRDVTCSVGTELVALRGVGLSVSGGDLDPVRVEMARLNVGEGVDIAVADALKPEVESTRSGAGDSQRADVIVADPARRNSSGRIHRLADMQPSVPDLIGAYPGRELMIKCAPGVDFADLAGWAGQVDVISVNGDVKEACAVTRGLVEPGRGGEDGELIRRAVVITESEAGVVVDRVASYEEGLTDDQVAEKAGEHGRYIMEPDGAIIRAGVVRQFAAREGLWLLDPHLAYVTGDRIPLGLRGFEVKDVVPVKRLKAELAARGVGKVEILVRGADIDPDQLRKKMKLKGAAIATVVIAQLGERGSKTNAVVAYICQATARSLRANDGTAQTPDIGK